MATETSASLAALKYLSGESSHICRLCFASTENNEVCLEDSIRVQRSYFDATVSFLDIFADLGTSVEPLLPQVLCMECANTVINCYIFQKLCNYSNEKWHETLNRLEDSLSLSEQINPSTKTAYIILNTKDQILYTSRKTNTKSKGAAVKKIKSIITGQKKKTTKKKANSAVCEDCGEQFLSTLSLMKHMKVHNKTENIKRIPCPQCAKYFATKMQVEDHKERVHYPKVIPCAQCEKTFSTERMLKRHEKIHHIAAICKICFVQFPSKNALRQHLDKHDFNKCDNCNKSFLNKNTFKLHLKICGRSDRKDPKFFCDICNKGYARKNSLRTHLKTDHGFGRVLTCSWCNKKFDAVSRLNNHIVKHTKEKNFYCEQCGGKFVTRAALMYHIRLHTGERPFPCDLCDESFLSASRRMEHKRRKHIGPSKQCPLCHMKFVTRHQLKIHTQRHNNPQSKLYVGSHLRRHVPPININVGCDVEDMFVLGDTIKLNV